MFDGFTPDVCWTHVVAPEEGHPAMPFPSLRDRTLMCSTCRQPQLHDEHGWHCGNPHCSSSNGTHTEEP